MRSNRDKSLEQLYIESKLNELHCTPAHRAANKKKKAKEEVEEAAPETFEDDTTDESSCNTNREGVHEAVLGNCPSCGEKITLTMDSNCT